MDGSVNLAPYSFFNAFSYKPPIIGFSSNSRKDSLRNVEETGEFVWNLVTQDLVENMNRSCADFAYDVDEFEVSNLTKAKAELVAPPRVAESKVNFECKVTQIIELLGKNGESCDSWMVLGEVVGVHIAMELLDNGVFNTFHAGIVLRAGGPSSYALLKPDARFDLARP